MKPMTRTQVMRLLTAPDDHPVRIHTYQNAAAYRAALDTGTLVGSAEHAAYDEPYAWMRESMSRLRGWTGGLPVWGWLRRPDGRAKMLDPTKDMVRITAIVPRGRMLISDYNLWSCVLNETHVHLTTAESDLHDERWPTHPPEGHPEHADYMRDMRASWGLVFDPLAPPDHDLWGDRSAMPLQACIDGVHLDEIVSVRLYADRRTHG